jgi:hypothetical protein
MDKENLVCSAFPEFFLFIFLPGLSYLLACLLLPRTGTIKVKSNIDYTEMYLVANEMRNGSSYRAIMHQMSMERSAVHTAGCMILSTRICSTERNSCAEADKTNAAT